MGIVLTVSGQKGGIGKSVIAVNLAATLALYEKKVLLVDCDPRGCATEWTGVDLEKGGPEISSLLSGAAVPADAVMHTQLAWLDILPAGFSLLDVALGLSGDVSGQTRLRRLIHEDLKARYAYVIIDAPSSWGILSAMAMTAADWHIAPVCPGMMTPADCHHLLRVLSCIRKTHGIPSGIGGFVFNRCHGETGCQAFLEKVQLPGITDLTYDTRIPADSGMDAAIARRLPLVLDNLKSPAGKAFLQLAKEIDRMFT